MWGLFATLVRRGGFSFASRLVVTRLGLGTASLPCLLAWGPLRRSNPTRKVSHTLLRREPEKRKNWQKPVVSFFVRRGGFEPPEPEGDWFTANCN